MEELRSLVANRSDCKNAIQQAEQELRHIEEGVARTLHKKEMFTFLNVNWRKLDTMLHRGDRRPRNARSKV